MENVKSMNYKVADIALSSLGEKEIKLAESEMPGLMTLRKLYKNNRRS